MQRFNPAITVRRISRVLVALLLLAFIGCVALMFRFGLIPAALNPLPAIDLNEEDPWLVDWRLAALRYNRDLCKRVLVSPHIDAQPIVDSPLHNGCGWINAVRMVRAGGVHAAFDKITCESAAALTLWLEHDVQQAAHEILGQSVALLRSLGTYSCRNIVGNPLSKMWRSAHATANAVDISGFMLSNGRQISVRAQWHADGAEALFLRRAHDRACRYFHVVLGPDYNQAHYDHFHLDRGPFWRCA
jgi:hypothetical protein